MFRERRARIFRWLTGPAAAVAGSVCFAAEKPVDFTREVQPILAQHCLACHGQDAKARKGDLRLDVRADALAAEAFAPGRGAESELIKRLVTTDADDRMPPPEKGPALSEAEVSVLRRWIDEGAPYAPHWAFVPPRAEKVPQPADAENFVRGPIDAFVLEGLAAKNWQPAGPAAKETWLRRVTFDLTGLPPTLAETDAFLADASDTAYGTVVDRLLAAPAYGERMAVSWLDAARYADTYGRHEDADMTVWPYRDWVIRAFNDNLPFDQFITWQTAGDLLPNPTRDQLIATCFNRLAQQSNEAGSNAEEFRIEQVADRVHTNGQAFLGLTMECARCHDHKFDPLSMRDYYGMAGFLGNIDELGLFAVYTGGVPPPSLLLPDDAQEKRLATLRGEISALEAKLPAVKKAAEARYAAFLTTERPPQPRATAAPGTWDKITGFFRKKPLPAAAPAAPVTAVRFDTLEEKNLPNDADATQPAMLKLKTKLVEGHTGHGVKFDAHNYVYIPSVPEMHRHEPFSFGLWVKPADTVHKRAVIAHRSRSGIDSAMRGFELVLNENRPSFGIVHFSPGNEIRIESPTPLEPGKWTHLAVTYDGSSRAAGMRLWVNGAVAKTDVVRDGLYRDIVYRAEWGDDTAKDETESAIRMTLGNRHNDAPFHEGTVDDFVFHRGELSAAEVRRLAEPEAVIADSEWFDWWLRERDADWMAAQKELQAKRGEVNDIESNALEIMVMKEKPGAPRVAHVLNRGQWNQPKEEVAPATPAALGEFPPEFPRNRLGYARWLTDRRNPLVARVAVNRVWQVFFGRGLVATSEDFGTRAPLPSHPELLDWLAVRFIDSGWNVKQLCREIALSSTYRQSSLPRNAEWLREDPENRWFARGPRQRLQAEQVRDMALAVSGLLSPRLGGPSVKPYQPAGLWEDGGTQHTYVQGTGEALHRRSLYTFWRRTMAPPAMTMFDAPTREFCRSRRDSTTTPLQSLVLMNDPQFTEAARVLAAKLVAELPGAPEARIERLFRLLTGKRPTPGEAATILTYFRAEEERLRAEPASATTLLRENGEEPPPATDLPAAEVAATTLVVRLLFSFAETTVKP